jgi:hypothetical protein
MEQRFRNLHATFGTKAKRIGSTLLTLLAASRMQDDQVVTTEPHKLTLAQHLHLKRQIVKASNARARNLELELKEAESMAGTPHVPDRDESTALSITYPDAVVPAKTNFDHPRPAPTSTA